MWSRGMKVEEALLGNRGGVSSGRGLRKEESEYGCSSRKTAGHTFMKPVSAVQ